MGRSKKECVIKNSTITTTNRKVMPHADFMQRIRKSLYFGCDLYDQEGYDELGMSKPLAEYASELFSDSHRGHTLNRLSSVDASSLPTATSTALIMSLIYLDRLNVTDPNYVRRITPQELFIVSMMISTKFYVGLDEEIYLSDWVQDDSISEDRLKQLELEFLYAINWNICISNIQFFEKLTNVEKMLAKREGLKRGWLTYNELIQMLPSFTLAKFILNNITVLVVSYAASVITIAGAFFLASQIPGTSLCRKTFTDISDQQPQKDLETVKYKTNTPVMLSDTLGNENNHFTSCNINTEIELIELEHQFREEALKLMNRQRQNEITTESRLTLPQQQLMAKLNVKQKCAKLNKKRQEYEWFIYKYQFSDELYDQYKQLPSATDSTASRTSRLIFEEPLHFYTNLQSHNETSLALFWLYLEDIYAQLVFLRVPFLWLKLM